MCKRVLHPRSLLMLLAGLLLSTQPSNAVTYNIQIEGTSVVGDFCPGPASCNLIFLSNLYTFEPGDLVNFGTLTINPLVQSTYDFQYDRILTTVYEGWFEYSNSEFYPQAFMPTYSECIDAQGCVFPPAITIPLIFSIGLDPQIQLAWNLESTYQPPALLGAIPEPSTWAMFLLGFAGIGLVTYRRGRNSGRPDRDRNGHDLASAG